MGSQFTIKMRFEQGLKSWMIPGFFLCQWIPGENNEGLLVDFYKVSHFVHSRVPGGEKKD